MLERNPIALVQINNYLTVTSAESAIKLTLKPQTASLPIPL